MTLVFALAVLQDYIYSRLQHTGFYLSESLLYNTFWTLFIPFTLVLNQIVKRINPKNKLTRLSLKAGLGLALSFLHILLFASVFVLVSNLVFTPSHRFSHIFNSVLSNQFYIAILWYTIVPFVSNKKREPANLAPSYPDKIKLTIGSRIVTISTSSIQLISTDKPYCIVHTGDQKILDKQSLREFEERLDPGIFLRVHRSVIINIEFIKELKSRSNGDYDAKLENGQTIRLSRHYRNNWQHLLR